MLTVNEHLSEVDTVSGWCKMYGVLPQIFQRKAHKDATVRHRFSTGSGNWRRSEISKMEFGALEGLGLPQLSEG